MGRVITPKHVTPKKSDTPRGRGRGQKGGVGAESLFARPRHRNIMKFTLGPKKGWELGVRGTEGYRVDPKRLLRSHIKKLGRKTTPAPQHQAQPGPGGDPGSQTARRGRGRGSTTPRGRGTPATSRVTTRRCSQVRRGRGEPQNCNELGQQSHKHLRICNFYANIKFKHLRIRNFFMQT